MMRPFLIAAALVLLAGAAAAQPPNPSPKPPPPITPAEDATLKGVVARGVFLYTFDRAAWLSTDVMKGKMPSRLNEIRGWIVQGDTADQVVTYYGDAEGAPYGVFSATLSAGKVTASHEIKTGDADRKLTPVQLRMVQARKTAVQEASEKKYPYCASSPPNTVILPPPTPDGPIDVYILTPQTKADAFPAGGHSLVRIGGDGKVAGSRIFTRACLEMARPALKEGETLQSMMVSHLLDPTPTELHVFLSLSARLPVAVGTTSNNMLWMVEGTKITKAGDIPALPRP